LLRTNHKPILFYNYYVTIIVLRHISLLSLTVDINQYKSVTIIVWISCWYKLFKSILNISMSIENNSKRNAKNF